MLIKDKLRVVDLFAGIGGFSLGFKMAGLRVLFGVEKSSLRAKAYERNINARCLSSEVKNICFTRGDFDVLIAGPPCEAYSEASRGCQEHPLLGAPLEVARVAEEARPLAIVVEEVPGFTRHSHRMELESQLKSAGYSLWLSKLIDAYRFGAPQRRVRYILVASRYGSQGAFHSALRSEEHRGPSCIDAISDLPEQCGPNVDYMGPPSNEYQAWARRSCSRLRFHIAPNHKPETLKKIRSIPPGRSLRSIDGSTHFSYKYYRLKAEEPAKTIVYPMGSIIIHPIYDRIISVREAARLQSLPDNVVFTGGLTENYYQVADATPTLLARALARALLKGLRHGV